MRFHIHLAAGIALCGMPLAHHAQVLISDSLLLTFTQQELIDTGVGNAINGIEVYRLKYWSTDADGQPIVASGAMMVPTGDTCYHSIACYMHGTILEKEAVPSRLSQEALVGYYLSGIGFVSALPDYLGLGDSPGLHPYVHAATEASASIDLLRAVREWCDAQGVPLNGQLFLAGYSQGGHACMATHRAIEQQFATEFTVTASAPCSGPYDVSGVQAQVMVDTVPYPAPYYLPYVVLAYGSVYPGLFNSPSEVFKAPWDTLLPPLFDGTHGSGDVDAVMPSVPSTVLQDSVLQAFAIDPLHPFRLALADNDLYGWVPQAPVRMHYCNADDHVFAGNTQVALQAFQLAGAQEVSAVDMGALDHGACAFPALLAVRAWLMDLQAECAWTDVPELAERGWEVMPTATSGTLHLVHPFGGPLSWSAHDQRGAVVSMGRLDGPGMVDVSSLPAGLYVLTIADGRRRSVHRFLRMP
ncbi:MAG TPA: hypothetical protein PKE21_02580 [Flavobacteriales bacterium]|nr:hypothetical protein [Flavobacteriales bacterium]HMR26342.1 hypothetical protein [Flavobacteriales bacterium]